MDPNAIRFVPMITAETARMMSPIVFPFIVVRRRGPDGTCEVSAGFFTVTGVGSIVAHARAGCIQGNS
jgi:hypothetical protein